MVISIYGDNIQSWCMYNNTTYYFYTCNIQILYRISCVNKVQYNECVPVYWGLPIGLMGILVQWDCFRNHCEPSSSWSFKTTLAHFVSGVGEKLPQAKISFAPNGFAWEKRRVAELMYYETCNLGWLCDIFFQYTRTHTHTHPPQRTLKGWASIPHKSHFWLVNDFKFAQKHPQRVGSWEFLGCVSHGGCFSIGFPILSIGCVGLMVQVQQDGRLRDRFTSACLWSLVHFDCMFWLGCSCQPDVEQSWKMWMCLWMVHDH